MTAGIGEKVFTSSHLCNIIGFTWYAVEKLSIFAVVLLNITRTISLFFPFLKIKKRIVIAVMVFLTTLPIFFFGYVFIRGGHFEYFPLTGLCNTYLKYIFDLNSVHYRIYFGTLIFIFHTMPMLIMVACLVLSAIKLFHSRKAGGRTTENKNRATITILLLGLIYTILNIPYNSLYTANLLYLWKILDKEKYPLYKIDSVYDDRIVLAIEDFSYIISVMLNPAINILVCVFRVRKLREFTINCIKCQCRNKQPKSDFGPTPITLQYNVYPDAILTQGYMPQNFGQLTSISADNLDEVEVTVLRNPSAEVIGMILPVPPTKMKCRSLPVIPTPDNDTKL